MIDQRTIDTNGGLHHKRSGVQRDDFESQLLIGFIGCGDWTWADAGCKTRNRYDTLVFVGRRRSRNREFRSVIDWSNDDRERRIRADVVVGERTCATVVDQVDDDDGRPVLVRSRHEGQLTGRGDSRLGAEQPGVGVERHIERQRLGNLIDSRRRPGSHIGCKTDDASGGYSGDRFVVFQDRNERRGNGVLRLVVDISHIEGQEFFGALGWNPIVGGDQSDSSVLEQTVDVRGQLECQIPGARYQRLNGKGSRIDSHSDDRGRLVRFIRRGQWAWTEVRDEARKIQEPIVFPHVERIERHIEDRWIVDLFNPDGEGLGCRTVDVWQRVGTIIDQADADQDRSGVEDIDIWSKVIGQSTCRRDARLTGKPVEFARVDGLDVKLEDLCRDTRNESEFVDRRQRTCGDVGRKIHNR